MPYNDSFQCPVCRAKQPLSEACRRCKADLDLVVRARLRVAYLCDCIRDAADRGDNVEAPGLSHELRDELRWLAPAVDPESHRITR